MGHTAVEAHCCSRYRYSGIQVQVSSICTSMSIQAFKYSSTGIKYQVSNVKYQVTGILYQQKKVPVTLLKGSRLRAHTL